MTDDQKYQELLKELGQVVKDKNDTITIQAWQIDELSQKLKAAEMAIKEMKGMKQ